MKNTNTNIPAHLAVFGANLIYAINYSVAKDVMPDYLTPNAFILIRVLGAVLLFWLLAVILKINEPINKKHWIRIAAAGLFGVAINQLFFFQGLNLTRPINAAIIMTMNPVMVLLIAAVVIKERINSRKIIGIVLGLSGAFILTTYKQGAWVMPSFSNNTALGDFMVLINATSYAIYLVIVKPLMNTYHPVTIMKWVFLFGLAYVIPFGGGQLLATSWDAVPGDIYAKIAFVVIGTTFFAYLFNMYGLRKLNPSVVSIYIYLQPFLATLVALLWGRDQINGAQIVSAAVIFAGVYLVSTGAKKLPKTKA